VAILSLPPPLRFLVASDPASHSCHPYPTIPVTLFPVPSPQLPTLVTLYPLYPSTETRHFMPYPVRCILHRRSEVPSSRSYTLGPKIYPSPMHSKTEHQSTTTPPLCPFTSCSFSPFASSVQSGSSPGSRSTSPATPPVPPLPLCLFSSTPATSCYTTDHHQDPSPEPPVIMRLCLCRSTSVCSCCAHRPPQGVLLLRQLERERLRRLFLALTRFLLFLLLLLHLLRQLLVREAHRNHAMVWW